MRSRYRSNNPSTVIQICYACVRHTQERRYREDHNELLHAKKKLVINTYHFNRIVDTIQKLEGFKYATPMDLNMGYNTMNILPHCRYMTTIVTKFGKSRYIRLLMGMCVPGDTSQSKEENLLDDIKVINKYIDAIGRSGYGMSRFGAI